MFLHQLLASMGEGDIDAMPDSIEGVIAARIDGLLPEDRNALRQLSVLGTAFRPEFSGVVLSEEASPAVLKRLSAFLDVEPTWVKFSNSLVHQAAYGGLPYKLRRDLHGRVAESIERSQGDADLLSVHYHAAGRWPEAWRYSRIAGDHAQGIYANLEAASFYERALESARYVPEAGTDQRVEVLSKLGEAHFGAGLYDKAGSAYRRARRLADDPLDLARLCRKEARIADRYGKYSLALRWTTKGRQALDGLDSAAAEAERAQLSVWRAALRFSQSRYRESIEACEQAIDEAQRAGDQDALARAYYLLDSARVYSGLPGNVDFSWRALAIYEELEDLTGQAHVYNNLAAFSYFDGRWNEAVDLYEKSRETWLRTGNPTEAARAEENLGEVLCDRGNLDEAESVLRSVLRVWKAAKNPGEVAFVTGQLGRVASRDGRFEEADALFAEALRGFEDIGARYDAVDVRTRIVENLVFQGLGKKAIDEIGPSMEEAETFGEGTQVARLKLMLGYAFTQVGRPKDGLNLVEESLDSARDRDALYEIALGLEARSRLRKLLGESDWAEALEEVYKIQETLGIVSIPRVSLYQR
jgi:tetratricopeptide (TPR) repeat protein